LERAASSPLRQCPFMMLWTAPPAALMGWPQAKDGMIKLTAAQLAMLIEGIDWRMPAWTARPQPKIHR